MTFKHWGLVFTSLAFFAVSCRPNYTLVKANRAEYKIDSTVAADPGIAKIYLPFKQKLDARMNGVLGETVKELNKTNEPECLLGNFFADAVMAQAVKMQPAIDFAMPTTRGGLRNNLPDGKITLSNLFELMPFENELVLLRLSGADTEQLLNFIAASGGQPVAGITLKMKDRQPYDVMIKGQPFNRNKTYFVLTSDYVANGGDNTKGLATPLERKNLGLLVRDALIKQVKQLTASGKKIDANIDGRITKN